MSPIPPVALILGAGPNIGANVAKEFAASGYKVALTSRKGTPEEAIPSYTYIQGDLAEPKAVSDIFAQVRKTCGEPSVVVYNAGAVALAAKDHPFETELATFQQHLDINTTSAFVAIKESVASFEKLPSSASRTFIYTGNAMNFAPFAGIMTLGIGKSASAHMLAAAAQGYKAKGYKHVNRLVLLMIDLLTPSRFYYADERQANGKLGGKGISGEAHAQFYKELAESKTQGTWLQTFVKGQGYVNFPVDTDVTFG